MRLEANEVWILCPEWMPVGTVGDRMAQTVDEAQRGEFPVRVFNVTLDGFFRYLTVHEWTRCPEELARHLLLT